MVLFNRGKSNEGVYTIEQRVGRSMGQLLTFETPEDAGHFTRLLQGEGFNVVGSQGSVSLDAQPFMWDTRRIEQFCRGSAFEVALVPSGERLTPPENNVYDPTNFGERPGPPEERFQNRGTMGQSMWNPAARHEQRRRAHDMFRKPNMTPNQSRASSVWDAAMRRSQGNFGQEMCGPEECGLDKYLPDREMFEKAYGAEMCGDEECGMDKFLGPRQHFDRLFHDEDGAGPSGPEGSGPWGPGPRRPGPWGSGPFGPGPWGPGPDGRPGWSH